MKNEREDQLKVILEQLARINSRLDKLDDRVGAIEKNNPRPSIEPESESPIPPRDYPHHEPSIEAEPRRIPHFNLAQEIHPWRPNQEFLDQEELHESDDLLGVIRCILTQDIV